MKLTDAFLTMYKLPGVLFVCFCIFFNWDFSKKFLMIGYMSKTNCGHFVLYLASSSKEQPGMGRN